MLRINVHTAVVLYSFQTHRTYKITLCLPVNFVHERPTQVFSLEHPNVNAFMNCINSRSVLCLRVCEQQDRHLFKMIKIFLYLCVFLFIYLFLVLSPEAFLNRKSDSSYQEKMAPFML